MSHALAAAGVLGTLRARAAGRNAISVGQLMHGGQWNARPTALRRLLWEVGKRTSIDVAADPVALTADSPELSYQPLVVWSAEGAFPPLPDAARTRLARYLTFGGLLLCDCADALANGGAAQSMRRELAAVVEGTPLGLVPRDHVIYKSFYLLDRAEGRLLTSPDLEGLNVDNRLAVVLSVNDLCGAYAKDNFGTYLHEVVPGGDMQRERAFRLGVNLMMYATCLDYKEDQVHIPFILKKRRR